MPIFDHFSILAPLYENFIKLRDPEIIIEATKMPVDGVLLDAGGGTGRVSQAFIGLASKCFVADGSRKMLMQAFEKDGLVPVCSYTEKLPFPDEYFDRIIMVDALHHVENQASTIAEMCRVLKIGGRLVIEEPDIKQFAVKLVAIGEKLALMRSKFMSPETIVQFFDGYKVTTEIVRNGHNAWIIVDKS